MAAFTDYTGAEWKLRLTYTSADQVKRETGVNLTVTAKDSNWSEVIFGDPGRLVGVLWVLCEAQAKERGLTPEQFGERFDGPTLEAAGDALCEGIADFFPRSRIAKALRANLTKVVTAAEDRAIAKLEHEVAKLMDSSSAANSPESSGAAPTG